MEEEIEVEVEFSWDGDKGRPVILYRLADDDPGRVVPKYSVEGLIRRCGEKHRDSIIRQCEEEVDEAPDEKSRAMLERAITRAKLGVMGTPQT